MAAFHARNPHDQWWVPINTLVLIAVLSVSLFGGPRSLRRRGHVGLHSFHVYLWILLTEAVATPLAEYALRGRIPVGHVVSFAILAAGLATILLLYRDKHHRHVRADPHDAVRRPESPLRYVVAWGRGNQRRVSTAAELERALDDAAAAARPHVVGIYPRQTASYKEKDT